MSFRNILLPALSASLLCACTAGGESLGIGESDSSQIYYFRGFTTVDRQYVNRYACAVPQVTLVCTCTSRYSRDCDCRC